MAEVRPIARGDELLSQVQRYLGHVLADFGAVIDHETQFARAPVVVKILALRGLLAVRIRVLRDRVVALVEDQDVDAPVAAVASFAKQITDKRTNYQ